MTMHDHGEVNDRRSKSRANQRRLLIALAIAACYMVAEVIGGVLTGSLALLADAGHMLSDVFALSMSVLAIRIAQRPPTASRTYGYYRTEILAALGHGVLLVCVSVAIFFEAWERMGTPREVLGGPMLLIAAGGLVANLAGLAVLNTGKHDNLNVRGAWLHVLSDALGSVGALAAGAAIWAFGWMWADTVASLLIGLLVIHSSWALLRETLDILMEAAPAHIDVPEIHRTIAEVPGVLAVHDLHVWTITSGLVALSGHVVSGDGERHGRLLQVICDRLHERFGIDHATIQIEPTDFDEPGAICADASQV
jgi:cobalt-zinc-cadmium efflux system protein